MNRPEFPNAWSTPVAAVAAMAAGGIVLVVFAAAVATDPAGRIIVGCAAVVLLGFAVLGGVRRPRLAIVVDDAGQFRLAVRELRRTTSYSPTDITAVRLRRARRLGRSNAMLEIDVRDRGTERLLVLTRWDLGTNPLDVLDALAAAGLAH
jgi:hypothetical protein